MKYRGVIFDFNGVLWWDGHLQKQAWNRFALEVRGTPFTAEEMAIHVHGRYNRHTLEHLTGKVVTGPELEELTEHKERIYRQLCLDQGPGFALSPGAVELLDFLMEHGIPRTIATASGKANVDFFVAHLGLARWFQIEQCVYDDGSRPGKPAPDIYRQAARNLGLEPARCVVVEDSRSGIRAAQSAGTGYIVALGPADTHSQLAQLAGVSQVVESLQQLPRERLFL